MKKVRAIFNDPGAARRTLDALSDAGFGEDEAFGLGLVQVDVEDVDHSEREMVVVKADDNQLDTVQLILKNGGADEVETMISDWQPDPVWDIAAFAKPTNA
ncbi:MAG: hypothetical protein ACK2UW_08610 [Anaerolineales bacterium]